MDTSMIRIIAGVLAIVVVVFLIQRRRKSVR